MERSAYISFKQMIRDRKQMFNAWALIYISIFRNCVDLKLFW